jgi:hypothetical protein
MRPGIVMILVGGLIVLCSIVGAAIRHERDQERLAQLYRDKGTQILVPSEMRSNVITFAEFSGFTIGSVVILIGVFRSRTT